MLMFPFNELSYDKLNKTIRVIVFAIVVYLNVKFDKSALSF